MLVECFLREPIEGIKTYYYKNNGKRNHCRDSEQESCFRFFHRRGPMRGGVYLGLVDFDSGVFASYRSAHWVGM